MAKPVAWVNKEGAVISEAKRAEMESGPFAWALEKHWKNATPLFPPSEAVATAAALAMEGAPTILEVIMRAMRDHYWDSLEPQKDLILKHIEGALRWLHQSSTPQPERE